MRLDPVAASLRDLVKHRLDAARHVGKLNQQVEAARQQLTIAQQAFAQIEGQLNETIEGEREAGTSVESETAALFVSYRAWASRVSELKPAEADGIEPAVRRLVRLAGRR